MCEFDLVSDRKVKDKVIGVRVTKEEKDFLECYAKIKGFRTISDCIRHLIKKEKMLNEIDNYYERR